MANTNLWDPVPWMVGGGAQHSTNVARSVAYAAFGGQEGIVSSTHGEVRALATPGSQVRVYPATVAIQNRADDAFGEMYVGRLLASATDPAPERVDIAPTTSSGRSDLIVVRVENPYEVGETWADPSNPAVGPYIFTRVIQNVSASTVSARSVGGGGYSAIALARIDLPPSTSVITQSMITDLRTMAGIKTKRLIDVQAPTVVRALTSTAYVNWPSDINQSVAIPDWATHANVRFILAGIKVGKTGTGPWDVSGFTRIRLGTTGSGVFSAGVAFNQNIATGFDRAVLISAASRMAIPASMRGTTQSVVPEAQRIGSSTGDISSDSYSTHTVEIEFTEEPTSNV